MKTYLDEMKKKGTDMDYSLPKIDNLFKNKGGGSAKPQSPTATAPTLTGAIPNKSGKPYEPSVNYTQHQYNAEWNGDYGGAMDFEKLHNTKEGDLGLGWGVSGKWNYLDPNGYGGRLEAMRDEIKNYKPFEYDYRTDDAYLSMKRLKEKEADKAYADGYAQLSSSFDGDIPVNMINKLLTTKNEIIDSADSYIPQLRQMAYDMYNVERNDLYNQYGLLGEAAQKDYNRWNDNRDIRMRGIENDIANRRYNQEFDYMVRRDNVADARYDKEWDYTLSQDAQARQDAMSDMAVSLFKTGDFPSVEAAYEAVMRLYKGAAAGSPSFYGSDESTSGQKISAPTSKTDNKGNPKVVETGRLVVDEDGKIKVIA